MSVDRGPAWVASSIVVLAFISETTAQLSIEFRVPANRLVEGEPAFIEVSVRNKGDQPVDHAPLWVWNVVAAEKQGLPFPLQLTVLRSPPPEPVLAAQWRRRLDWQFERWQPGYSLLPTTVRLWPGERSQSWVDLGWQYELGPGRYIVRWGGPLFGSAGAEQGRFWLSRELDLPTQPLSARFTIQEAWGPDREALRWSDYRIGTRTPPEGERSAWIASVDSEKVAGSVYARWVDYLVVQHDLAFGGERGEWRRFSPEAEQAVQRWLALAPGVADHPMKSRIEMLCQVKRLLDESEAEPARWPTSRQRIQGILAQSLDQEWAYYLVRFAAWRDVPFVKREDYPTQADYFAALEDRFRVAREVPTRWGYPWFRLPPDQRPGGAAAGQEP